MGWTCSYTSCRTLRLSVLCNKCKEVIVCFLQTLKFEILQLCNAKRQVGLDLDSWSTRGEEEEECPAVDNNIYAINWERERERERERDITKALSFRNLKSFFSWTKTTKRIIEQIHTYYSRRSHNLSELFSQPKQSQGATVCSSCQSAFTKGHTWHQATWMHCSENQSTFSHKSFENLS